MKRKILILGLLSLLLVGCGYWKAPVQTSQVGLLMHDGTTIDKVVGPGRYSDFFAWYARIVRVDVSSQTVIWSDPDLVTSDKQPIGLELAVTYARDSNSEAITDSWTRYNAATISNDELQTLVLTRIPRVAKEVTTKYSLDEMLGVNEGAGAGRGKITQDLFDLLDKELSEINVILLDVGVNDIAPSERYLELIEEKANAQVEVEVARARTLQLQEQLESEKAQTDIELEQARRENLVAQEKAQAFDESERAYELRRLELLAEIIGPNDKMFFIPEGGDLTLLLDSGNLVPAAAEGGE